MFQIRFIKKDSNCSILKDENIELFFPLSPVERPSYIEFIIDGETKLILFEYAGSTEKYHQTSYNAIKIEYGVISGRIKSVKTDELLQLTDIYNLCQQKKESLSQRFEENFKRGLELARLILLRHD